MSVTRLKTGKSIDDSLRFDGELRKYWATKSENKYIVPREENNSFNVRINDKHYGAFKTLALAKSARDNALSLINFENSLVLSS